MVEQNLAEYQSLREAGFSLPKSGASALKEVEKVKASVNNRTLASSMRRSASNVMMALPKVREPLSTLSDKGIPFNYTDENELIEMRRWCRLFYATHDLVPLLVDIYSKFPVAGMSLSCKDPKITEFYEDMFFNELEYETFLQDMGREFFTVGECTTLGHFDETLGIWSSEEILNPDQLTITRPLFKKGERVFLKVKELVDELREGGVGLDSNGEAQIRRERLEEYKVLKRDFPELIQAADSNEGLELADSIVSRMSNKMSYWDKRGTPHMLRSFRALMMEESLNAAQDAVADRLYSPFILAKLGVQNIDGKGTPWVPTPEEINGTRDDMQSALSADFRLMVHNFGLDVSSVFGRESVPRFDQDYNRIDEKLLQAWGIGKSLISGGSGGPYASSALNREFVTQMMSSFQSYVRKHLVKRMEVVAEAQGHYDYDIRGGVRYPIMQEVVRVDEETGERYIVKVPKLLIPDVVFSTLNLRDETQERSFLQTLKSMGVPVSDETLAVNVQIDFEEELEKSTKETIQKSIAQSQAMVKAKELLEENDLPLPPELVAFFESAKGGPEQESGESDGGRGGAVGGGVMPPGVMGLSGTSEDGPVLSETPTDDTSVEKLPRNTTRPPESDEQRGSMPKASLTKGPSSVGSRQRISQKQLTVSMLSGSSIRLDELFESDELLDALELSTYAGDYRAIPEFKEWLQDDLNPEQVPSDCQEAYGALLQARDQLELNQGGELLW